jgi:hypothetical protein
MTVYWVIDVRMKYIEINKPIEAGKKILKELKKKYSNLDAYIVVSSRFGQLYPGATVESALRSYSKLFVECPQKAELLYLIEDTNKIEMKIKYMSNKEEQEHLKKHKDKILKQINDKGNDLLIDIESTNIELRFGELDHDLINEIRCDPLIDVARTSQTKASIRIVLGSLRALNISIN